MYKKRLSFFLMSLCFLISNWSFASESQGNAFTGCRHTNVSLREQKQAEEHLRNIDPPKPLSEANGESIQ